MKLQTKSISAILLAAVLLAHYIGLQVNSSMLPTYLDTVYSFGAGAKLAYTGHFADTFMLHGLLNPYIVEVIIRAGAAGQSFLLARQAQAIWAALTLLGIYGSLRSLLGDRLSRGAAVLASSTMFLSTMTTIELLDIRPECPSMAGVSLLLWICLTKHNRATPITTGILFALLIGARPTNILLIIPAVSVAFSNRLSGRISSRTLTENLLLSAVTCCVVLSAIFPGYILHIESLAKQFNVFFWTRDPRTREARVVFYNAALAAGYLWLAVPGLFHALGLSIFSVSTLKRHENRARLSAFLIGTLPFTISICLNANFQPRYFLPVAPVLVVCSIVGHMDLFRRSRGLFLAGAAATVLISGYQGYEIWTRKMTGGLADLLQTASEMPVGSFSGFSESFQGSTYGSADDPSWPLMPFISDQRYHSRDGAFDLYISDVSDLEGYAMIDSTEMATTFNREIRRSTNPGLVGLLVLVREPWTWRSWGTLYLMVENGSQRQ